ncbi:MAG: sulfatase-like hydrolase/transferase [Planctomycetaceae bacterium]|nr:sulfatase-like hydrolase/transferase [Planctomycetaceae bacterium]
MYWVKMLFGIVWFGFFTVAATALTALTAAHWTYRKFDDISVDQIVYHIVFPLDGVDPSFYYSFARNVLVGPAVSLVVGYLIYRCLAAKPFFFSIPKRRVFAALAVLTLGVATFSAGYIEYRFGAVAYCQKMLDMFEEDQRTYFSDNYVRVEAEDVTFPEGKNNLMFLILESGEGTFNDASVYGGNLIPKLDKIAADNLSFSRHVETYGTSWSAASLCSMFLGVPYIVPGMKETTLINRTGKFLPGASSLLHLLETAGYDITFLIGTDVKFGGTDLLFNTHCRNANLEDVLVLADRYPSLKIPNYRWGYPDQLVYSEVKKKISAWTDDETPHAMILMTVNTHHPGYKEPESRTIYNDMRDAFVEMDDLAADFLAWFQNQPAARNTTVVIIGDHLLPANELGSVELPPKRERQVYNAIINSRVKPELPPETRLFTTYDFSPTILESLGGVLPKRRLGIGTSLFSSEKTLLERDGIVPYEREIARYSPLYNSFLYGNDTTAAK